VLAPGTRETALAALRWVARAAVPADGGLSWPDADSPGQLADDLYSGTAGVLIAFAEARLAGIEEFDAVAAAAASRLRHVAAADAARLLATSQAPQATPPPADELGLYTGLAGHAAALSIWANVAADTEAATSARAVAVGLARATAPEAVLSEFRDLIMGEAGILVAVLRYGGHDEAAAAGTIADRLVAQAEWIDGAPDWRARSDLGRLMPNFSHGAAGIGFALALASVALDRPDLLYMAQAAGRRLVRLGSRSDGTLAVPNTIPPVDGAAQLSYGWCHGPAGTVRLFQMLDLICPGEGWSGHAEACRRAVRDSGLPARSYPGFWDNLGQCCGTAGVGEMALDHYQDSRDPAWLEWGDVLARDVLDRAMLDDAGVRWSHTEHRRQPSDLPPTTGWMQGAAGIAAWLLRLTRVHDDAAAPRMAWPDRPWL
jgi:lantibiotic modifying enzyme